MEADNELSINYLLHKPPVHRTACEIEQIRSFASALAFVSELSAEKQFNLCRVLRTEQYNAGDLVYKAGDVADRVYIVAGPAKCFGYRHSELDMERFKRFSKTASWQSGKSGSSEFRSASWHTVNSGTSKFRTASGTKEVQDIFGCKAHAMLKKSTDELMNTVMVLPPEAPSADPAHWRMLEVHADQNGNLSRSSLPASEEELFQMPSTRQMVGNVKECRRVERLSLPDFEFCVWIQFEKGQDLIFSVRTEEERTTWIDYVTSFASSELAMTQALVRTLRRSAVFQPGAMFGSEEIENQKSFTAEPEKRAMTVKCQAACRLLFFERQDYMAIILHRELFTMQERVDLLRRTALFGSRSKKVLFHSAKALVPIIAGTKDVICKKGERTKGVYVVYRGFVTLYDDENAFSLLAGADFPQYDSSSQAGTEEDLLELDVFEDRKVGPVKAASGMVEVGRLACTDVLGDEQLSPESCNEFTVVASHGAVLFLLPVDSLKQAMGLKLFDTARQRAWPEASREGADLGAVSAPMSPIGPAVSQTMSFADDDHTPPNSPPRSPVRQDDLLSQEDEEGRSRKGAPRISLTDAGMFLGATLANPFTKMPPLEAILDSSYSHGSLSTGRAHRGRVYGEAIPEVDDFVLQPPKTARPDSRDWSNLGGARMLTEPSGEFASESGGGGVSRDAEERISTIRRQFRAPITPKIPREVVASRTESMRVSVPMLDLTSLVNKGRQRAGAGSARLLESGALSERAADMVSSLERVLSLRKPMTASRAQRVKDLVLEERGSATHRPHTMPATLEPSRGRELAPNLLRVDYRGPAGDGADKEAFIEDSMRYFFRNLAITPDGVVVYRQPTGEARVFVRFETARDFQLALARARDLLDVPCTPSTPSELATTHLVHCSTEAAFKPPSRPASFNPPSHPSSANPPLPFYPRRPLPRTDAAKHKQLSARDRMLPPPRTAPAQPPQGFRVRAMTAPSSARRFL